ncbi:MAG: hypothetical protein GTO60_08375, partial [Gammaproteobacteria bacterium]|nr:hypothetical protein [Gammaproteobacteria bacterium]
DRVREFDLQRGIIVNGHLIPYAATPEYWPEDIRNRLEKNPGKAGVHLGSTRAEFTRAYGAWFTDLVFDEMMQAYPILMWKREHGIPEEKLLDWLFPWFFPLTDLEQNPETVEERGVYSDESRIYHYKSRHADPPSEPVLYPAGGGGYAAWIHAMLDGAAESIKIHTGLADIRSDIDPDHLEVHSVTAGGIRYTADNVFWCAPLPVLCKAVGWQLPKGEPQWELLGSFTFDEAVNTDYHEILFADPSYRIRRINFPGLFANNGQSRTLQVEYTTLGDEVHRSAEKWQRDWLGNFYRLGIISEGTKPEYFDFKRVPRGIVSTEDLGRFLADCEQRISDANTNLVAPHMAVASDNNARLVPKVFRCIEHYLAQEKV